MTFGVTPDTGTSYLTAMIRTSSGTSVALKLKDSDAIATQAVAKVSGTATDNNVILGGYTAPTDHSITSNTFVTSATGTVYMRWLSTSVSAIHSVAASTGMPTLTNDNTMTFGITPDVGTSYLTAMIRTGGTSIPIKIKDADAILANIPPTYRAFVEVTTLTLTLDATHANKMVVYNPSTTGTQQITMASGLAVGTEIEIFNASTSVLEILASPLVTGSYLVGTIKSVSGMVKININGAAIIKVWKTGSTTVNPVYLLIGSLTV